MKRPAFLFFPVIGNRNDIIGAVSWRILRLIQIELIPEPHNLISVPGVKVVIFDSIRMISADCDVAVSMGKPAKDPNIDSFEFPNGSVRWTQATELTPMIERASRDKFCEKSINLLKRRDFTAD
ncbi:MAG: hypothetical protein WD852_05870 [Methyloceanibacter sp.]